MNLPGCVLLPASLIFVFMNVSAETSEAKEGEPSQGKQEHVLLRASGDQESLVHNGPVKDFVFAVRYVVYKGVEGAGELHVELRHQGVPVPLLDKEPQIHVKYKDPKWWKYADAHIVHHSIESLMKGHYWTRMAPNPDTWEEVHVRVIFPGKQGTLGVTFTPEEILSTKEVVDLGGK